MNSLCDFRIALLIGVLWVATTVAAQDIRFNHLTVEDGLSDNAVRSILEDRQGYLWVGTDQGLNRYDGYDVKVYRHIPGDATSLQNAWVMALVETRDGTLWAGTNGGGLSRFDRQMETFTTYRPPEKDPNDSDNGKVWALLEASDGTIWVGTASDGLNRFDPATETFTQYRYDEDDPHSLSSDRVWALLESADGTLWVGTQGNGGTQQSRLNRFDPDTETFTRYKQGEADPMDHNRNWIFSLHESRDGTLWVGTADGGLKHFDPATGSFTTYRHQAGNPNSLSDDDVFAIHETLEGKLWLGTASGGLNHFDPATETFTRYRYEEGDPSSLRSLDIWTIYETVDGTLWVGTMDSGLSSFNPARKGFTSYRHQENDPSSLSHGWARSLLETEDGTLWVGTDSGLNRFDSETGAFVVYPYNTGVSSLPLFESSHGTFWVGRERGVVRFNPDTGTFRPYRYRVDDSTIVFNGRVTSLMETPDGMLWVGTGGNGLARFDLEADKRTGARAPFTNFLHQKEDAASLSDNEVNALLETREEMLWVGTRGAGLNLFDPDMETFIRFRHVSGDSTSLSHDLVNSLYEAPDGSLWVGTGDGVNRVQVDAANPASVSFIRYTAENTALDGSGVGSILQDEEGLLWLGLMNGRLARLNPQTGHVRTFGPRDGIPVSGVERAALRTTGGQAYFSGNGGVIAFDPATITVDDAPPRLYLTALRVFNQVITPGPEGPLETLLSETQEVTLTYTQNDISIDFVGIHHADTEGNRYNYRLVNYDPGWRGVTTERRATYTNLSPGRYRFEVKAANSDGYWTPEPVTLDVAILPPWWRTMWAYLLYGLLFLAGVFAAGRLQRRRLIAREREKARERELEQAREIEKAHTELQKTHTELAQAHEHLKVTQQQLVQQEKMASLGQLTAGIAHEIKNPLNFVNNFAEVNEELAQELHEAYEANPEIKLADLLDIVADLEQNATVIGHHGKRADGIVHAMMQHASGGTGQREATDLNQLVLEHIDLAYHGKRAQLPELLVEIERDLSEDAGQVEVVPQEIGRVLLNLLGNAFDAVHEHAINVNGANTLSVAVRTRQFDGKVEIRIEDNGPGIPTDIKEKIFEPFFTTKPTGSGTGLGLSLSYDIVTQGHGGTLVVESEEGQGATFIVTLPVHQTELDSSA